MTLSIPESLYNLILGETHSISEQMSDNQQNVTFSADNHIIKGVLKGGDKDFREGIIGGSIIVYSPDNTKNYKEATMSNIDGEWILSNVEKGDIIQFGYIGFKYKEIKLTGEVPPIMDVILKLGKGKESEEYFYDPNDKS